MAENSTIEWCDHTFNPWLGCTKISPGCDHCYAESWARRVGKSGLWHGDRRLTSQTTWQLPIKWNRDAAAKQTRYRIFCASLADVFDNQIPDNWRADLWNLIQATPNLDWILLTKRPQNIMAMLPETWGEGWPNVWLGTSAENQTEADRRIPYLLEIKARVRFLSCEPLLGLIELDRVDYDPEMYDDPDTWTNALRGERQSGMGGKMILNARIDWVIAGGESGPGARPMHPDWVRALRDQCAAADVPFLFKQWGEWAPAMWKPERQPGETIEDYKHRAEATGATHCISPTSYVNQASQVAWSLERTSCEPHTAIRRYGKKRAGRLLDSRVHHAFPETAR